MRLHLTDSGNRFVGRFGFADHAHIVDFADQLDQPGSDRRGILDDEYPAAATRFHLLTIDPRRARHHR